MGHAGLKGTNRDIDAVVTWIEIILQTRILIGIKSNVSMSQTFSYELQNPKTYLHGCLFLPVFKI